MKKFTFVLAALAALTLFVSCASTKEIPGDKTSAQIIQMGQNAFAKNDYKNAINCYKEAIARFGSDGSVFAEAKYEIGHVYMAQKKYDDAYRNFRDLLYLYDNAVIELPPAYRKLAENDIEKIPAAKLADLKATYDALELVQPSPDAK